MFAEASLVTSRAARRRGLTLLIGGALACLCGPSVLADLRYKAKITGVEDSSLADLLDEVSELKSLDDRLPASEEALRRRADRDLGLLQDAAHSLSSYLNRADLTNDSWIATVNNFGPIKLVTTEIASASDSPSISGCPASGALPR